MPCAVIPKTTPPCRGPFLVNTSTQFFCDPSDISAPSSTHPVILNTDSNEVSFRFVDANGLGYPLVSVSGIECLVTVEGAEVFHNDGARTNISHGLDGNVTLLLKRTGSNALPVDVIGEVTFSVDGVELLNDSLTITSLPAVSVPQQVVEVRPSLEIMTSYQEPSEELLGRWFLYFGENGLLVPGNYYQCALVNDTYTWLDKTPPWINAMRWREWA